jgi:hypothetical protein
MRRESNGFQMTPSLQVVMGDDYHRPVLFGATSYITAGTAPTDKQSTKRKTESDIALVYDVCPDV